MSEQDKAVESAFAALADAEQERLVEATRIIAEHGSGDADALAGPLSPAVASGTEPADEPPQVFWWAKGTEAQISTAMARLTYFVEWLVDVYELPRKTVPACWMEHPAVVQELWALMCVHAATYAPDELSGPISFAFNLAQSRARLNEVSPAEICRDGHASRRPDPGRDARRATYPSSAAPFVWTWPPAPTESEEQT